MPDQGRAGWFACDRCDTSGYLEGPDPGWYEVRCPACCGEGFVSGPDVSREFEDHADRLGPRPDSLEET